MESSFPAETDVLVVGGGPTGLTAAVELGQRGIDCVLVEPRTSVSHDRPRAKTTNIRTMEHFRRLGLAERIREVSYLPVEWSQEAVFCTALLGEEITRCDNILGMQADRDERFAESAQQIPQFLVEEVLREGVEDSPAVSTAWGWRLTGFEQRADGVTGVVENGADAREVSARYLLGCDGAKSSVRKQIDARFEGEGNPRPNLGIVIRDPDLLDRQPHGPAIHFWVINNEQPGLMGPLDLEDRWWLIAVGVDEPTQADPMTAVEGMVGESVDAELVATDPWRSRLLLADTFRDGRVFLAGDAASLNPPWGGLGFNTGVADAIDISWKLAAVIQGWGGDGLLDSYTAERRPIHERVLRETEENMNTSPADLAERFIDETGTLDEATRQRAAERIHAAKELEFYSLGLVLGYRYEGSPIIMEEAGSKPPNTTTEFHPTATPGARLPHTWLSAATSLYDELATGFTLLTATSSAETAGFVDEAAARGVPLGVLDLTEDDLRDHFGADAVLVRPDQHVAWRGRPSAADPGPILDRVVGRR